jgi:hypothetical protein
VISHVLAGRKAPLTSLKPELLRFITLSLAATGEARSAE